MSDTSTKWSISTLERNLPDGDQYPDGKVISCVWGATYEEDGGRAYASGSVYFGEADPQHYIPYEQLTEEQVLQWVFDALGPDQIVATQESLYNQVQALLHPATAVGVPW